MLRHHTEEEHAPDLGLTPAPGQSQVIPITPQELAQAIVSVETRQRADAPIQTKTITLEDTIRQLELTVTPEELLTELHAQRTAAHQQAVMTPRKTGRTLSWWLLLTGCILSTATTIFISFMMYVLLAKYNELWKDVMARNASRHAQTTMSSPGLRPLSAFQPHDPAYVSFKDLQALANGASPSRIQAASWSTSIPEAHWGIEQENGRYVVRVDSQRSSANAADKMEWVTPSGSGAPVNYTEIIPVERFKHTGGKGQFLTGSAPIEEVLLLRGSQ